MRDFGVGKTSLEEKILEEVQGIVAEFERANGKDIDNVRDIMTRATCNVIHHLMFGYRYTKFFFIVCLTHMSVCIAALFTLLF